MALPKILQKLFANSGAGPKLREDIMPKDYLPTAGGTMAGKITTTYENAISREVNTGRLFVFGGTAYGDGSSLTLFGKESSENAGGFELLAYNNSAGSKLVATAAGALTWGGIHIARSVNGQYANSQGEITIGPEHVNCLPLDGGNMTGNINFPGVGSVNRATGNYKYLSVKGEGEYSGEFLAFAEDSLYQARQFACRARGENGAFYDLRGYSDGNLTWGDKQVERVNSSGTNYIRFESGLQICWGKDSFSSGSNYKQITWPVAFVNMEYSTNCSCTYFPGTPTIAISVSDIQTTSVIFYRESADTDGYFRYVAIGRWK